MHTKSSAIISLVLLAVSMAGAIGSTSNAAAPAGSLWIEGSNLHWADGSTEYFTQVGGTSVKEFFDDESNGDTPSSISGFAAGPECGTCQVSNDRAESGSLSFEQNINAGDDYQNALIKDFSGDPLTGTVVVEGEYWESSANHDGNFWVQACDGTNLAGIGTENPQFEAVTANGGEVVNNGGHDYQEWTHVEMKLDLSAGSVDFYWNQQGDKLDRNGYSIPSGKKICKFGVGPDDVWYVDSIEISEGDVSEGPVGSTWVEGSGLHWIDQDGFERSFQGTDTGNSPSGASPGSLWLEDSRMRYVDSSGVERVLGLPTNNVLIDEINGVSSGQWYEISYPSMNKPIVITTSEQTGNGDGLVGRVRNVGSKSAEIRICDSDGGSNPSCESSSGHDLHYMVVDAASVNSASGIEAGSVNVQGEIDSNTKSVSFTESFSSNPVVLTTVMEYNGKDAVDSRALNPSSSGFSMALCRQDSDDGCESLNTKKVGYVALEPGNIPISKTDAGFTPNTISDSNFYNVNFGTSYSSAPTVFAEIPTNDGGHEPEHEEVRNIGTADFDVRYCELESGDNCDGHTSEEMMWFSALSGGYKIGAKGNKREIVDNFEDGDLSEYSKISGAGKDSGSVQTSVVHSGSYAAEINNAETTGGTPEFRSTSGLSNYPQPGDTITAYVNWDNPSNSKTRFRFADDGTNSYQVTWNNNDGFFSLSGSDISTSFNALVDPSNYANTWTRVVIDWGTDGTITATWYDGSGNKLAQVSRAGASKSPKGIALLAQGRGDVEASSFFDNITIQN